MFRGRSALVRGLALVAVLGLIGLGCGVKPEKLIDDGKAFLEAGDIAKAEEMVAKVFEIDPENQDAKDLQAKIEKAKEAEAERLKKKEAQEAAKALAAEAETALAAGKLDEAETKAKEALAKDAENQAAKDVVAKVAEKKAATETARRETERKEAERKETARRETERKEAERKEAARKKEALARAERVRIARDKARAERAARDAFNSAMRRGDRLAREGKAAEALAAYREARRIAPDARNGRRADAKIADTQRKVNYDGRMAAGKKAMAEGDVDKAIRDLAAAQAIRDTPKVRQMLQEARAVKAEAEGDQAKVDGKLDDAIAKYETANSLRPTDGLTGKIVSAKAEKARADYLAKIDGYKRAQKANRFGPVAAEVAALAKKYPQWKEARKLHKEGPSNAERTKIEGAATKAFNALNAKLKKIPANNRSAKILAIEAAMPQVLYSKKEAAVEKMLKREKDAVLQGRYTQVTKGAEKLKGQAKIDHLTKALPEFEGSGHYDKLARTIKTERSTIKKAAWDALVKGLAKKKPQQQIDALKPRQDEFKGTTYEKQCATKIKNLLNTIKAKDYKDLLARLKKQFKTSAAKIAELQKSLPSFKGSKYESLVNKAISKEKTKLLSGKFKSLMTRWKKEKDPKKKLAILEAEAVQYAGTKFEKKIKSLISKGKAGLEAAVYKDVSSRAGKMKDAAKKLAYLKSRQGEFKSKTYVGKIKGLITAAQKAANLAASKAADTAAKKVYDKAMADAKKLKANADKLKKLTEALQKVAGSKKYVDMLNKEIKKLQPKPPKPPK